MTNGEKYKNAQERTEAFYRYCHNSACGDISAECKHEKCALEWLDLEYDEDEEKPLPCLWCKSEMQHVKEGSGHFLACVNCNHTTRKFETMDELVGEYNRVAKAVKESEAK